MNLYKVSYENTQGVSEFSFEAPGRTIAEKLAEEWIENTFFPNKEITIRYFYTLLDVKKGSDRKISCCNQMSYPQHGEENKHGIKM